MGNGSVFALDGSRAEAEIVRVELDSMAASGHASHQRTEAKPDRRVALVENRTFMRDCITRGLHAAISLPVATFSTVSELESQFNKSIVLFFLSLTSPSKEECGNALKVLSALDPTIPIVVLSTANDWDLVKTAVDFRVKGYIPYTTNFEIAFEAVRFILAGGTYFPVDYLFSTRGASTETDPPDASEPKTSPLSNILTDRERSVVKAIQEGKSNKVIAYKLCICEGTVKVHLRNIMKKLNAKNRTDVAIKAQAFAGSGLSPMRPAVEARLP